MKKNFLFDNYNIQNWHEGVLRRVAQVPARAAAEVIQEASTVNSELEFNLFFFITLLDVFAGVADHLSPLDLIMPFFLDG